MKSLSSLLPLSLLSTTLANNVPQQLILGPDQASYDQVVKAVEDGIEASQNWLNGAKQELENKWNGFYDDVIEQYQVITHSSFPSHRLLLKQPQLCDPNVTQYSGYLDISSTKHLFFWFFESRNDPDNDDLVMWLNGGPGCSSSTGLLFELGPCSIASNGNSVTHNPHSWNSNANLLFLDQPIAVGYSYSEGGESIGNSKDSAKDVWAFMQLWMKKFGGKYSKNGFSLAAESYGGHYAPNIANHIWDQNKLVGKTDGIEFVPLKSVMIGNGLTDPLIQYPSIHDYACPPSDYAILDNMSCQSMESKLPLCTRLASSCYSSNSRFSCVPAQLYCASATYGPFQSLGKNPYDTRRDCDRNGDDGPLCYKQMEWIEVYLNKEEIKKELGVPSAVKFQSCNMNVNQAFALAGDGMHDSGSLLKPLIEDGIRVLIYAGEWDFMCNWLGNQQWVLNLETSFQEELVNGQDKVFVVDGVEGGLVRTGGKGAGNFTFLKVFGAGHMVPYDQPIVSLEMLNRWLRNEPLYD